MLTAWHHQARRRSTRRSAPACWLDKQSRRHAVPWHSALIACEPHSCCRVVCTARCQHMLTASQHQTQGAAAALAAHSVLCRCEAACAPAVNAHSVTCHACAMQCSPSVQAVINTRYKGAPCTCHLARSREQGCPIWGPFNQAPAHAETFRECCLYIAVHTQIRFACGAMLAPATATAA